jgi:hypothetical protein
MRITTVNREIQIAFRFISAFVATGLCGWPLTDEQSANLKRFLE